MEIIKNKLENIVQKYSHLQDLSNCKPPTIGNVWQYSSGNLSIVENAIGYENIFSRKIVVGVHVGTRFANYDRAIRSTVISEIKSAIRDFVNTNCGWVFETHGCSYSLIGLVNS